MTVEETFAYIHKVNWRGSKPGLSRTRELLRRLGDPQKELRFIHVAGTNGKGSVCAMLASVLQKEGYRTGLYTSPYMVRFNERIRIDGEMISDSALCQITERVRPFAESMADLPTEFELITALAMTYFAEQKCDIVVLEVGLGGELDSTNVIDPPILAVITALGLDHTRELGPTVEDIARAKAGIIKPGSAVAFYGGEKAETDIIRTACRENGCPLAVAKPGFADGYTLGLSGRYQRRNADLVLTAIDLLNRRGFLLSEAAVREGLSSVKWPGRFEKISEHPTVIVDGGHNPHGIQATAESLASYFPGNKIHFLFGLMADKDADAMIRLLLPLAADFVTITPDNPRAMPADELAALIGRLGGKAMAASSCQEGVQTVLERAGSDEIVCAVGSLYSYREVSTCFREITLLQ